MAGREEAPSRTAHVHHSTGAETQIRAQHRQHAHQRCAEVSKGRRSNSKGAGYLMDVGAAMKQIVDRGTVGIENMSVRDQIAIHKAAALALRKVDNQAADIS